MNLSTVTFQFAHNYGAVLQALALKQHLSSIGHTVKIAPYIPEWARLEYAFSPFEKGISVRKRVRFAFQYIDRKKLVKRFEKFAIDELEMERTFSTVQELTKYLSNFDAVIYGSDQIWNNNITGNTDEYFGGNIRGIRKISYAASIGTKTLTDIQRNNIESCLPDFYAISVREQQSKGLIEEVLSCKTEVVCDPVFLLPKEIWRQKEKDVKVVPKYMLAYFLQRDDELLKEAIRYAKEKQLTVYSIHPTLASSPKGCTPLECVGPAEFLWLIDHAECVCTNSFHATSFSVIFRKKLLHIPNRNSPGRTVSLLRAMGIALRSDAEIPLYDFSSTDYLKLNEYIERSKKFINNALAGDTTCI